RDLTKMDWDLKIKAERANQTTFSNMLDKFNKFYVDVYRNRILAQIDAPLSKSYLAFTGFPIMNAAEAMLRTWAAGHGTLPDFRSYNHFAAANSFIPDVPPSLFQKSPLEKAASLAEGIKAEMGEGFITSLTESSLMRPFNYLLDQGSHFELQ